MSYRFEIHWSSFSDHELRLIAGGIKAHLQQERGHIGMRDQVEALRFIGRIRAILGVRWRKRNGKPENWAEAHKGGCRAED